jgi:hypothetical protein
MTSARCARGARFFTLGALLLLCGSTAKAQVPQRPSAAQAAITVRGHWVFEVRERDGSGVKRYEFDNALIDARPLLATLSRQNSPGYWNVGLGDFYGDGEPCLAGATSTPTSCALQEPGDATVFSGVKKLSVLSVSMEGGAAGTLVLQGTFTAEHTGQISSVTTGMGVCPNTVAPATPCSLSPAAYFFTSHVTQPSGAPSAGGPIPVAAGQIVQVRVEIRFSSASAS